MGVGLLCLYLSMNLCVSLRICVRTCVRQEKMLNPALALLNGSAVWDGVMHTYALEAQWTSVTVGHVNGTADPAVVWVYACTPDDVFRVFPGHNPVTSSWCVCVYAVCGAGAACRVGE